MQEYTKYRRLILKYLKGDLKQEEIEELLDWLERDPRHKDYFHKLKQQWQPFGHADENIHEAFQEVKSKLALNKSLETHFYESVNRKKRIFKRSLQAAAILIIGMIAGYFWTFQPASQQEQAIQYTTIEAAPGERSTITLPDGSKVWLNSASRLRFPSSEFSEHRLVHLTGEAYFNVKNRKKTTFTVKTKSYNVQVTGTEFNVMAYEEMDRTETTLVEGSVTIIAQDESIQLHPKHKFTYQNGSYRIQKGDTYPSTSWKEGVFYFDQTPFHELIKRLERWYNVSIHLQSQNLMDIKYSGVFKNQETIWEVLDVISMTTPIEYQKQGTGVIEIIHKSNSKSPNP